MRCGFSGNVLLVAASTLLAPALGTGSPILAGMGPVHHMLTHVGPPAVAAAAPADNGGTVMMDLLHAYRQARQARLDAEEQQRHHRQPMRLYERLDFGELCDWLNGRDFCNTFGLDMPTFDLVLRTIGPDLAPLPCARGGFQGPRVPPQQKLACCLRWLRGGQYIDQSKFVHYHSPATMYVHNRHVITAINRHFRLSLLHDMDALFRTGDTSRFDQIATGFGARSRGCIDKGIGALDGVQVARPACATRHSSADSRLPRIKGEDQAASEEQGAEPRQVRQQARGAHAQRAGHRRRSR